MTVHRLRLWRTSGKHRAAGIAVTRAHDDGFEPPHCSGVTPNGSDCIAHDHQAAVGGAA